MACYCMSATCLSGNVWINCLYASVSVSCESMIGYTADLGSPALLYIVQEASLLVGYNVEVLVKL